MLFLITAVFPAVIMAGSNIISSCYCCVISLAASPNPYRGRPSAFRSAPLPQEEDSPGERRSPASGKPTPESPPAPPGSDAGPSQPARHCYRTTIPSEAAQARRHDVSTSVLAMKGCLGDLWAESMNQMDSLSPLAQMDRFSKSWAKVSTLFLFLNASLF